LTQTEEVLLPLAEYRPCNNWDARPTGTRIDLLVIHNISLPPGEFGGHWIDDLFMNRLDPAAHPYFREIDGLKVSSHLLIRRDGQLIQYVPLNRRAWHAGASNFCGRDQCNDFSIGIELEGSDLQAFTDAQYKTLIEATQAIQQLYPEITRQRITGHSDIAPARKTDPGPRFDWTRYLRALADKSTTKRS
jgi:AmpD protein